MRGDHGDAKMLIDEEGNIHTKRLREKERIRRYDTQHNNIQHDDTQNNDIQHNNKKPRMLSIMTFGIIAECFMLIVVMLNVANNSFSPSVIMPYVVMPSVVVPGT